MIPLEAAIAFMVNKLKMNNRTSETNKFYGFALIAICF